MVKNLTKIKIVVIIIIIISYVSMFDFDFNNIESMYPVLISLFGVLVLVLLLLLIRFLNRLFVKKMLIKPILKLRRKILDSREKK